MILAIDFDGTLTEKSEYPVTGKINEEAIECCKLLQKTFDAKLILWTCREGAELQEAVDLCKKHGLYFDAINDNIRYNNMNVNSRKVYADFYIDDKSTGLSLNWRELIEEVKRRANK